MIDKLYDFFRNSGFYFFFQDDGWKYLVMIALALLILFLAVFKKFEPYLLLPIGFAMLLVNIPGTNLFVQTTEIVNGEETTVFRGLFGFLYYGVHWAIYPSLIFLCIGATTDFGPLIANPKSILLGGAAQIGIFFTFLGALLLGFTGPEAASIGIIGGADGPTSILLASRLSPHLLGAISLAAYSYMALVPIIQTPIIKALTTKKERSIKMEQLREVKRIEKVLFPIIVSVITILLIPTAAAIVGMLMLGNLLKESDVVPALVDTLAKPLLFIITVLLGLSIGATTIGTYFLNTDTLVIIVLGLVAFSLATVSGLLGGKLMCKLTNGKINPMIGAAGVSAVPMAARVVHLEGQKEDPSNFLLMHAMGPNVAGVIGSAITAGLLLMFFT